MTQFDWMRIALILFWIQGADSSIDSPLQINERTNDVVVEERAGGKVTWNIQPFSTQQTAKLQELSRSQSLKKGIPDAFGKAGMGSGILHKDNGKKSTKDKILDVLDFVVPAISAAMAAFGPVGAMFGGALSLIYGLVSPHLRDKKENPIEIALNDIYKKLGYVVKRLNELPKEIKNDIREERNAQLSYIMYRAFNSELTRNAYICNKYSMMSMQLNEGLKNNSVIDESQRIEMIAQLENCDNFLKDTASAFVYPEFGDVLWFPSVLTTLARLSFLTEVLGYRDVLKIAKVSLTIFWEEILSTIKNHFEFTMDAVNARKRTYGTIGFMDYEYQACRVQKLFIFFNKEWYPFGVPMEFVISDEDTELKIANFNATDNNDTQHIQVFYNGPGRRLSYTMLNCFMGSPMLTGLPESEIWLWMEYVAQKSYQVKVIYFLRGPRSWYSEPDKTLVVHKEVNNTLLISLTSFNDNVKPIDRFTIEAGTHDVYCRRNRCDRGHDGMVGRLVVDTAVAFNVMTGENSKGLIVFRNRLSRNNFLIGMEFIVRPPLDFLDEL